MRPEKHSDTTISGGYEREVEDYFETAEGFIEAFGGIGDEGFGRHLRYVGFELERNAEGLGEAAEGECGKGDEVVLRHEGAREIHVGVDEGREDE